MAIYVGDNTTIKAKCGGKLYCLYITRDDFIESPREWDGNPTTMACFHSRYSLGDSGLAKEPDKFWQALVSDHISNDELIEAIKAGKVSGVRIVEQPNDLVDVYETTSIVVLGVKSEPSEGLEYEGICRAAVMDYVLDDLSISNCMELMKPHAEWLPLWLYDHSGLTISCGARVYPYNDRWDSGQVGWIVALKDKIMAEAVTYVLDEKGKRIKVEHRHPDGSVTWSYKYEKVTEETWRSRAVELMKADVKIYDQYLRGETYAYTLYTADVKEPDKDGEDADPDETPDWEEQDSCGGFLGDNLLENGILEELPAEFADAVKKGDYEEGTATLHTYSYFEF